ncbi:MAG: hypothetical protein A2Z46_07000 [Nitrospirae bacterium RBG_19FT_COMBO_55_12]|nr:MAG: hypothetical protein A2Z46_07000 [Nitrospirae bacterium RBG_19FT_COMBO_55_12]
MRKEAEAWIKIAAEELQSAEYLSERKLFRMVCYHAQQSVEKVLKALLVEHDVDIPRTHNILDLNNAVKKIGYETKLSDEDTVFLNSIYRARYPAALGLVPSGEPTAKDAEKALHISREMAIWLKRKSEG